MSTIYQQAIEAGCQTDSHESDLHIKVDSASRAIMADYASESGVTRFRSELDGQQWYDVPFAFDPYWLVASS